MTNKRSYNYWCSTYVCENVHLIISGHASSIYIYILYITRSTWCVTNFPSLSSYIGTWWFPFHGSTRKHIHRSTLKPQNRTHWVTPHSLHTHTHTHTHTLIIGELCHQFLLYMYGNLLLRQWSGKKCCKVCVCVCVCVCTVCAWWGQTLPRSSNEWMITEKSCLACVCVRARSLSPYPKTFSAPTPATHTHRQSHTPLDTAKESLHVCIVLRLWQKRRQQWHDQGFDKPSHIGQRQHKVSYQRLRRCSSFMCRFVTLTDRSI